MRAVAVTLAGLCAALGGCAGVSKTQYFMVKEPDGQRAMYRMEFHVAGAGAQEYKLTTGYLPVSAIDALAGDLDEPNDLYAETPRSQKQAARLEKIDDALGDWIVEQAQNPSGVTEKELRDRLRYYGALYAAGSLSDAELRSIGQTGSCDPYAYRKLVIFVSTKVIDIKSFESQLKAIEKTSVTLADSIRKLRQARVAAAKAKADRLSEARTSMLNYLKEKPDMTKWTGLNFLEFLALSKGVKP